MSGYIPIDAGTCQAVHDVHEAHPRLRLGPPLVEMRGACCIIFIVVVQRYQPFTHPFRPPEFACHSGVEQLFLRNAFVSECDHSSPNDVKKKMPMPLQPPLHFSSNTASA